MMSSCRGWRQLTTKDGPSGIPARRMLAALLVVLLAAALVAGTFFWLGRQNVGDAAAGAPDC